MQYRVGRLSAAVLLLLLVVSLLQAQVQPEEGTATIRPWSGWWWPAHSGHLVLGYLYGDPGALYKHDQVSGRHAAAWERKAPYHFTPGGPDWWGHCHAWAAASILEPEPRREVTQNGVTFHVGDLKGLLSEAHFSDKLAFYGQRLFGHPEDDFQDMYPQEVRSVLRQQIYQNKHDYVFVFRVRGGVLAPGSDHWVGKSVQDHPDFAWYPVARAQENPELDYLLVTRLTLQAR